MESRIQQPDWGPHFSRKMVSLCGYPSFLLTVVVLAAVVAPCAFELLETKEELFCSG